MMEISVRYATPEECRLMDEAVARATALGRPFEEQEVFASIWEQGYDLYPALDNRFELHQEGCWQGHGDKKQFQARRWIVRSVPAYIWVTRDEGAHIEDSVRSDELALPELEETIVSSRLSVRASAQVDCESGELEMGDENGLHLYDIHEALELRTLLNRVYPVLYRLANA